MPFSLQSVVQRLQALPEELSHFPWATTAHTLRERFREDRLGLTASSLTFTTVLALVPFVAVALAVFTAFPMFAKLQDVLQRWLVESLVPDNIARQVLGYLTQFASKANRLGLLGFSVLLATALALILTIDRTLNAIWRVRKQRPIAQRVLVYWAAITLGPLLLGISLTLSTWALTASRGVVDALPGGLALALQALELTLLWLAIAALFRYVPNTDVRWRHALAGSLFVAAGLELAKRALAWYMGAMPGIAAVYGTFATLPILLLWIFMGWLIVLCGALVAAHAPSLRTRVAPLRGVPGQRFGLTLALLRELRCSRQAPPHGLTLAQLAERQRADPLELQPLLDLLSRLDWVARADEAPGKRYVLLCDPDVTRAESLIDELLLAPDANSRAFRQRAQLHRMTLAELLAA